MIQCDWVMPYWKFASVNLTKIGGADLILKDCSLQFHSIETIDISNIRMFGGMLRIGGLNLFIFQLISASGLDTQSKTSISSKLHAD